MLGPVWASYDLIEAKAALPDGIAALLI